MDALELGLGRGGCAGGWTTQEAAVQSQSGHEAEQGLQEAWSAAERQLCRFKHGQDEI